MTSLFFRSKLTRNLTPAEVDSNFLVLNRAAFYNVVTYGAVADASGTTDSTAAFQAAINACVSDGGGTVYIPYGIYYLNGALTSFNSVINIPQTDPTKPTVGIRILGETPPAGIPYDVNASLTGAVIRTTRTGDGNGSAILSCGNQSTVGNKVFNYVSVVVENLTFYTQDNPTIGGINARYAESFEGINVVVSSGVNQFALAQPTNTVPAFCMPRVDNRGIARLTNCWAGGYGTGVRHSEHFMADDVKLLRCKVAIATEAGYHTCAGTFNIFHCPTAIKFEGPALVDFHFDLERSNDNVWWDYRYEPGNAEFIGTNSGAGIIRYAITKAGVGADLDSVTITGGAANLQLTNLRAPFAPQASAGATPAGVTNFTVGRNGATGTAYWSKVLNATGYEIIYRLVGDNYPATPQITVGDVATSAISGLDATKDYEFSIRAVNGTAKGVYSAGVIAGPSTSANAGTVVEENDSKLTYTSSTAPASISNGNGGSMKALDGPNASAKYSGAFAASQIVISTIKFPDCFTSIDVLVDNAIVGTFNAYAAARQNGVDFTFACPAGNHTSFEVRATAGATANDGSGGHIYFDKATLS